MTVQSLNAVAAQRALHPVRPRFSVARVASWLAVPVFLLVIWQCLALVIGDYAIVGPLTTLNAVMAGFEQGWLQEGLLVTLRSALYAALIAGIGGVVCGFLLGRSPFWRAVLEQPAVWFYSLPKIVLYPILVLVLGLGAKSNIAFAVLQGFFPPLLIMSAVIADLPAVYVKLARTQRLSNWHFFSRIVVPYALPSLALSFRYCFSLTYIGIVVAEMFAAESGMGFLLIKSISLGQIPRMFAIVAVVTGFALAVNFIMLAIEKWLSTPARQSSAVGSG